MQLCLQRGLGAGGTGYNVMTHAENQQIDESPPGGSQLSLVLGEKKRYNV